MISSNICFYCKSRIAFQDAPAETFVWILVDVRNLRRNLTTARSLRPIGESLETCEKASGTLKEARSRIEGEVPALNRVGKVMP